MNITEKSVSELKAYENNPKVHTDRQIEQIMRSIELTHGLRQPIVIDKDNTVVCGHGRLLAALRLGYDTVPCELVDDLTDDEVKAYRLIDNEIAKGETDSDLLMQELDSIESVDMSDFDLDVFSMDDFTETNAYDEDTSDKQYFTATLEFPASKKRKIQAYLRKNKAEIIRNILKEVGE